MARQTRELTALEVERVKPGSVDKRLYDGKGLILIVTSKGGKWWRFKYSFKGQKSEESTWKRLQGDLAGIDSPQEKHRGLLIEFSATFGQVAELEHAFDRYAKSVVFDYAYDRFHADLYGKDLQLTQKASPDDFRISA